MPETVLEVVKALLALFGAVIVVYVLVRTIAYAWFRTRNEFNHKKGP